MLDGGAGADHLNGGTGKDKFVYSAASESTSTTFDTVTGADFNAADRFDFTFKVKAINHAVTGGTLSGSSFDHDLSHAITAGALGTHHAVLFEATHGTDAGQVFLIVDANGHAGYQPGQDFVIHLDNSAHLGSLNVADFI